MSQDLSTLAVAQAEFSKGYQRRARLILERNCEENPPVLLELGLLAYRQGLVETALIYYDRALAISDEIPLIHGLRSLTLETLGRRAEAYQAWLNYCDRGIADQDPLVPELDRFRPCALNFPNFDLRYSALCLDFSQSSVDGFSREYVASDFELARVIHRLGLHYFVGGWALNAVVADEASELASVVAEHLGLPLVADDGGGPYLHFAMRSDGLRSLECVGLTFAMFGDGLADRSSPDILGVAACKPMRWSGDSAEVRRLLEALWLKSSWRDEDHVQWMHRYLRPRLHLLVGWEKRVAVLANPSPAELICRIRGLNKDALSWCHRLKLFTPEIAGACWEALESAKDWHRGLLAELILQCPAPDWRRLLLEASESAWLVCSYVENKLPEVLPALLDVCIRENIEKFRAVRTALELNLQLDVDILGNLDLSDEKESELWFRHQPEVEVTRCIRDSLQAEETLTGALAVYSAEPDPNDTITLRELLFRRRGALAALALTCLEKLGDRTCVPDLVRLAREGKRFALPALFRMGYLETKNLALELLESHTENALSYLTALGSSMALPFVREALTPYCRGLAARAKYLDVWGGPDEEMLENFLSYPGVRQIAARALIRRGEARYWEVFRGEQYLDPGHGYLTVAVFLLEWGTPEAIAFLMAWRSPENVLSEVLLTNRNPKILALAQQLLDEHEA